MTNKILGTIIAAFGALVIFSSHQGAWIVSAICCGLGAGIFMWKDKKNNIDN